MNDTSKRTQIEFIDILDDDMNNLGDTDTFGQIKNDFNLLYTDEYITMIPDDLLKLELELLIEKCSKLSTIITLKCQTKK